MRKHDIKLIDDYLLEIADFSSEEHWDHLECIEKIVCHLKRNRSAILDPGKIELLCMMAYAHKQRMRVIRNIHHTKSMGTGRELVEDF